MKKCSLQLSAGILWSRGLVLPIEKGLGEEKLTGQRGKEDLRLAGHRLVKRRHTHVGAPDNKIEGLYLKSMS